jgi:Ricin-type beta-trefoil lectin domain
LKERIMRVKLRVARASALAALGAIIIASAAGITVTRSASAAPLINKKTCTFAHVINPTSYAIDSFTNRKIAWTHRFNSPGEPVTLQKYEDTLNQCWQFRFGFGHGQFEITNREGLCLTANPTFHGSGVPLELQACLSKKTQLFVDPAPAAEPGIRFQLVRYPKLCVASDTKIQAGAVLYQNTCSNSQRQHWWVNTNP